MLAFAESINNFSVLGKRKAALPLPRLFLLGVLAGFWIGLGALASLTASHAVTNAGLARLISGLLFPCGLFLVILTGAELFTGNCLLTLSWLDKQITLFPMLRNLFVSYCGNFCGSLLLAWLCTAAGLPGFSEGALAMSILRCAAGKCALSFFPALLLGILCNVLVCAAVLLAGCGKTLTEKALGAFVPVFVFVLCGFEHCVANMFYIPLGLLTLQAPAYASMALSRGILVAGLTVKGFLLNHLLPVTLGNLIGGAGFASLLRYCLRETQR